MRHTIVVIILSLCIGLVSSCVDIDTCPPVITYEVTGVTGSPVGVEFHNDYGDTEAYGSVRMPWVKTFSVKYRTDTEHGGKHPGGVFNAYITVVMSGRSGSVTGVIYINGVEVARAVATPERQVATVRYVVRL